MGRKSWGKHVRKKGNRKNEKKPRWLREPTFDKLDWGRVSGVFISGMGKGEKESHNFTNLDVFLAKKGEFMNSLTVKLKWGYETFSLPPSPLNSLPSIFLCIYWHIWTVDHNFLWNQLSNLGFSSSSASPQTLLLATSGQKLFSSMNLDHKRPHCLANLEPPMKKPLNGKHLWTMERSGKFLVINLHTSTG